MLDVGLHKRETSPKEIYNFLQLTCDPSIFTQTHCILLTHKLTPMIPKRRKKNDYFEYHNKYLQSKRILPVIV